MNGFSDHDATPEIGHLLGLRWFQLTTRSHNVHQAERTINGTICVGCTCGDTWSTQDHPLSLEDWGHQHQPGADKPVLAGARAAWEPGENVATCLLFTSYRYSYSSDPIHPIGAPVPLKRCHCGYWAYWKLGNQQTADPHVVAVIKGYGNIIEGSEGFRCSHAKIEALFLPGWSSAAALALEYRYAPVYSSLGAMLLRHPAPAGQPPLADDFYIRQARERGSLLPGRRNFADGGIVRGNGGWDRTRETIGQYAQRLGLTDPPGTCARCGEIACGTGKYFCDPCALLNAREATTATLSGEDALKAVHARRESWAGGGGNTSVVHHKGSAGAGGGGGGYSTGGHFTASGGNNGGYGLYCPKCGKAVPTWSPGAAVCNFCGV